MTSIDTRKLANYDYSGYISGINNVGQVMGEFGAADGNEHTFITGPNGVGIRDIVP